MSEGPDVRARGGRGSDHAARRAAERATERSEVRAAVVRFLVAGLVTVVAIGVPSAMVMRQIARNHALADLAERTVETAANTVGPLVDADLIAGEPEAVQLLDRLVEGRIADGSLLRLTLWQRDGLVLYSDADALIGERFPDHDWGQRVLRSRQAVATLEDDGNPKNAYEHDEGRYVEVDVAFAAGGRDDLILEMYYPSSLVHAQQSELLLRLLPVGLMTLVVLQLAQLPPAASLARRVQGLQSGRRRLMRQAAAASDLERRRIARDLHDDVIQELAGVGYSLESIAASVDPSARPVLERGLALVRSNVATLRSMLVEIYPADPDEVGLEAALERLADPLRADGVDVTVAVDDAVAVRGTAATLLYRVAREALSNARTHAAASTVSVRLERAGSDVQLTVRDDGVGFDVDGSRQGERAGHLGLRLIADTVEEMGGHVELRSGPGDGTTVVAAVRLDPDPSGARD